MSRLLSALRLLRTPTARRTLHTLPLHRPTPAAVAASSPPWRPFATPPSLRRSMFIQTETTPNASALKFIPGTPVLPAGSSSLEYLDGRETHNSPLARKLFAVDGVRAVFYGPDFITITKTEGANWAFVKPEVFALITEALAGGGSVVVEGTSGAVDTMPEEGDSEVVSMVKELLDTRIRPSIQEGGIALSLAFSCFFLCWCLVAHWVGSANGWDG